MRLAPDVIIREEDAGFLLYDIKRDILYEGNETGKRILVLCDGHCTVEGIIDTFTGAIGSSREEISEYVCDFLGELHVNGLLEPI